MKRFTVILMISILFLPVITSVKVSDAVVGGPYTDKISAELGSASKSSGKGFSPDEIIVSVGTTVTWTNKDTVGHTVTSGSPNDPDAGKLFDSGSRWAPGEKFEHTFDAVGEFPYFCMIHPWTTGKVVVAEVVIQGDGTENPQVGVPEDDMTEEDMGNGNGTNVRNFVVEDVNGDLMSIRVSPRMQDTFDALTEMAKTGQRRMIGGEVESFDNKFGFRFMPDTLVVVDSPEGPASQFNVIQEKLTEWGGQTVYVSGKVVSVRDKITVNYQESGFNVTTTMTNGGVKSIEIEPDSTNLSVKLETSATKAGNLTITLPRELIDSRTNGEDKDFMVKVDNGKADYKELKKTTQTERKLRIEIPSGANQVEIIGTQVVPEFPLGLAVVLAGLVSVIVVLTRLNVNKILQQ